MDLFTEWFNEDSKAERGRVLAGRYRHYCDDWDEMTMDETCAEWPCNCGVADEWRKQNHNTRSRRRAKRAP